MIEIRLGGFMTTACSSKNLIIGIGVNEAAQKALRSIFSLREDVELVFHPHYYQLKRGSMRNPPKVIIVVAKQGENTTQLRIRLGEYRFAFAGVEIVAILPIHMQGKTAGITARDTSILFVPQPMIVAHAVQILLLEEAPRQQATA
jgi:hypothetical protein